MKLKELAVKNKNEQIKKTHEQLREISTSNEVEMLKNMVFDKIRCMEEDSNHASYEYGQGGWYLPDAIYKVIQHIYDSGEIPEKYIESIDSIANWLWRTAFNRLEVCWALSQQSRFNKLDRNKVESCTELSYDIYHFDSVVSAIKSLGYNPNDLLKDLSSTQYYSRNNIYKVCEEYEKCSSNTKYDEWKNEREVYLAFINHDAYLREIVEVAEVL